jgi:ribosomal protein S19
MALILDSLYDALKAAGASEEQARTAGRDVAAYDNRLNRIERDLTVLRWMVGAVIAVQLGTFWMQWQVIDRLAGIDARITAITP